MYNLKFKLSSLLRHSNISGLSYRDTVVKTWCKTADVSLPFIRPFYKYQFSLILANWIVFTLWLYFMWLDFCYEFQMSIKQKLTKAFWSKSTQGVRQITLRACYIGSSELFFLFLNVRIILFVAYIKQLYLLCCIYIECTMFPMKLSIVKYVICWLCCFNR